METAGLKLVTVLTVYGPLGVLAALGFVLYFLERRFVTQMQKRNEDLANKLYDLSVENIKSDMEHSRAYAQFEKTFDVAISLLGRKDPGNG